VEGPSADDEVVELRERQRRNFMVTLLLSQGVPMILGGDELGRSQGGNNNAYCQDNEISWYDWSFVDQEFLDFCCDLVRFRHDHPVLRRRRWFQGRPIRGIDDMAWFRRDGVEMSEEDWTDVPTLSVGVFLNGQALAQPDRFGRITSDDTFLLLFNGSDEDLSWKLPSRRWGSSWVNEIDTAAPGVRQRVVAAGRVTERPAHSVAVLRRRVSPRRRR
ncbi:MAG: hypothetical protein R2716_10530, partial [Microthrixaceae bacterium]